MCSWEQIFVKHERPCVILLQKIIMEAPIIAAAYSISGARSIVEQNKMRHCSDAL